MNGTYLASELKALHRHPALVTYMRDKRPIAIVLVVVIMASTVIGWQHYYPTSLMFRSLGLPGPRANTARECRGWYRQDSWGGIPTRELTCRGPRSPLGFWDEQEVQLDRVTRRIVSARRIWPLRTPPHGQPLRIPSSRLCP